MPWEVIKITVTFSERSISKLKIEWMKQTQGSSCLRHLKYYHFATFFFYINLMTPCVGRPPLYKGNFCPLLRICYGIVYLKKPVHKEQLPANTTFLCLP